MDNQFEKKFKVTLLALLAIIAFSLVYIGYCLTIGFSRVSTKLFELSGVLSSLLGG
ncbi:hypothetical protein M5V91_14650 [Cytobacillus pseudoceanisediminis]|uniref:hypothetical protein n=1 Tax=Cytobacillus pseudoceanisediminis TaxID=3051614 RepID=UPI002184B608|nr:hypothetical protein [Cytobacillus pseudoceanisediminis]UQX52302.1 hypothetical protein M5V91_14650 [Cytobacillus pseudoceanisediminis]